MISTNTSNQSLSQNPRKNLQQEHTLLLSKSGSKFVQQIQQCSICLQDLSLKNQVSLSCNHKYHFKCILNWHFSFKYSCPLCQSTSIQYSTFNKVQISVKQYKMIQQALLQNEIKKFQLNSEEIKKDTILLYKKRFFIENRRQESLKKLKYLVYSISIIIFIVSCIFSVSIWWNQLKIILFNFSKLKIIQISYDAHAIIAIGIEAKGVIAIGIFSFGLISISLASISIFSLSFISIGGIFTFSKYSIGSIYTICKYSIGSFYIIACVSGVAIWKIHHAQQIGLNILGPYFNRQIKQVNICDSLKFSFNQNIVYFKIGFIKISRKYLVNFVIIANQILLIPSFIFIMWIILYFLNYFQEGIKIFQIGVTANAIIAIGLCANGIFTIGLFTTGFFNISVVSIGFIFSIGYCTIQSFYAIGYRCYGAWYIRYCHFGIAIYKVRKAVKNESAILKLKPWN